MDDQISKPQAPSRDFRGNISLLIPMIEIKASCDQWRRCTRYEDAFRIPLNSRGCTISCDTSFRVIGQAHGSSLLQHLDVLYSTLLISPYAVILKHARKRNMSSRCYSICWFVKIKGSPRDTNLHKLTVLEWEALRKPHLSRLSREVRRVL